MTERPSEASQAGIPDAARKVAYAACADVLTNVCIDKGIFLLPSDLWLAIQDATDATLAAALPHLERAAIERFIARLSDEQLDGIDDLATKWANTAPDGTKIHGFDMDRWREGFREGLRRVLYAEQRQ